MVKARRLDSWDHTAAIISSLANIWRDPKRRRRAYEVTDFHPYRQHEKPKPIPVGISALRVFIDGHISADAFDPRQN